MYNYTHHVGQSHKVLGYNEGDIKGGRGSSQQGRARRASAACACACVCVVENIKCKPSWVHIRPWNLDLFNISNFSNRKMTIFQFIHNVFVCLILFSIATWASFQNTNKGLVMLSVYLILSIPMNEKMYYETVVITIITQSMQTVARYEHIK